jgi:hypothetical protein
MVNGLLPAGMIRKSVKRFSEKMRPKRKSHGARACHPDAIAPWPRAASKAAR